MYFKMKAPEDINTVSKFKSHVLKFNRFHY